MLTEASFCTPATTASVGTWDHRRRKNLGHQQRCTTPPRPARRSDQQAREAPRRETLALL